MKPLIPLTTEVLTHFGCALGGALIGLIAGWLFAYGDKESIKLQQHFDEVEKDRD